MLYKQCAPIPCNNNGAGYLSYICKLSSVFNLNNSYFVQSVIYIVTLDLFDKKEMFWLNDLVTFLLKKFIDTFFQKYDDDTALHKNVYTKIFSNFSSNEK